MRTRVTIGDFSRASHLSVKTLRHYHEIPVAQVIRRLRGLQMPVSEVRSVLATSDSDRRNRLIVEHLDRLELELAHTRAAVQELRNLLQRPDRCTDARRRHSAHRRS
jgi:DNA-binding transcriptional MerR regulator